MQCSPFFSYSLNTWVPIGYTTKQQHEELGSVPCSCSYFKFTPIIKISLFVKFWKLYFFVYSRLCVLISVYFAVCNSCIACISCVFKFLFCFLFFLVFNLIGDLGLIFCSVYLFWFMVYLRFNTAYASPKPGWENVEGTTLLFLIWIFQRESQAKLKCGYMVTLLVL
jgi:hypothetical protein